MQRVFPLCHICEYNSLQQHRPAAKKDFMHTLRCILRSYRLAFVSDKPNSVICEYLRRILCYRSLSGNQNTLIRILIVRFVQYVCRVLPGDQAIMS